MIQSTYYVQCVFCDSALLWLKYQASCPAFRSLSIYFCCRRPDQKEPSPLSVFSHPTEGRRVNDRRRPMQAAGALNPPPPPGHCYCFVCAGPSAAVPQSEGSPSTRPRFSPDLLLPATEVCGVGKRCTRFGGPPRLSVAAATLARLSQQ